MCYSYTKVFNDSIRLSPIIRWDMYMRCQCQIGSYKPNNSGMEKAYDEVLVLNNKIVFVGC